MTSEALFRALCEARPAVRAAFDAAVGGQVAAWRLRSPAKMGVIALMLGASCRCGA